MYRSDKKEINHHHRGTGIEIILLAAGLSQRMGKKNKLLMPFLGKPIIRHVAEQLLISEIGSVTVITGHERDYVEQTLSDLPLHLNFNPGYKTGQMASVNFGLHSLREYASGVMIALGDMPSLTAMDYKSIVQGFRQQDEQKITIPCFEGQRGNPIILPRKLIGKILFGSINAGCKKLIEEHPEKVHQLEVNASCHIRDIDTPQDYVTHQQSVIFPACC
ncbi:NTP transferase domain-containing protein [Kiloniella sp. EL199]|uniref:nucleotidyltransferase family protein n=1 Tax=Kiloniella sp. EL199 TaxID=2107581 RepID=UPI000EA0AE2E|nr:nucleotidyltransferase family protein [Kiloniella sp. EL199]